MGRASRLRKAYVIARLAEKLAAPATKYPFGSTLGDYFKQAVPSPWLQLRKHMGSGEFISL